MSIPSKKLGIVERVAWSFFAYGRCNFNCSFCLEKRLINNIEGYVLDILPLKHAKIDPSKTYFDLSFQADNNNAVPEKWQRLKKYQEDSTGCVISSAVQDS